MVSKIESFIQYMFACLIIILSISMWIMLVWMWLLPTLLSFVKEENYFFIPLLLGLIILLLGIILIWLISRHNFSIPIKFAFYITIYLTIHLATGCFLYSLVVVEVLSDTSFATIYVGFITITTIVASIIKYWDSKQLKWTFSVGNIDGIYIKRFTNNINISPQNNQLNVIAQCNKDNSILAFAGFCLDQNIHAVAGKRKNYLSKIYNPKFSSFLTGSFSGKQCYDQLAYFRSQKSEQNLLKFRLKCSRKSLQPMLNEYGLWKNWLKFWNRNLIWVIFFDNRGEIWGLKVKMAREKNLKVMNRHTGTIGTELVRDLDTNVEYWKDMLGRLTPRYDKNGKIRIYSGNQDDK